VKQDTLAALDLGSNSFHLQIGRVVDDQVYLLDSLRDPVRLGAGLTRDRRIDQATKSRALEALARFGERLTVRYKVEPEVLNAIVPTLVVQPLVENAVKHGMESSTGRGTVSIIAEDRDDECWIVVRDNGRGFDATGLVVAPGFIDLHAHGQSIPADRMQAFDGVTTSLDLEAGVLPVASWYNKQAAKGRVLNYGAAVNWAFARIGAMTGSNAESSLEAFGNAMRDRRWIDNVASDAEVHTLLAETGFQPADFDK